MTLGCRLGSSTRGSFSLGIDIVLAWDRRAGPAQVGSVRPRCTERTLTRDTEPGGTTSAIRTGGLCVSRFGKDSVLPQGQHLRHATLRCVESEGEDTSSLPGQGRPRGE